MAVEATRGCGSRKVGGLYMVGSGLSAPCLRMPANVEVCPVCGEGLRFFRGWRTINARGMFGGNCKVVGITTEIPKWCAVQTCPFDQDKVGLMWVGEKFYTPEKFIEEAHSMGVSKRINAVPKDFVLGETWVLLAHKKAGKKMVWRKGKQGEQLPLDPDMLKIIDGSGNRVPMWSPDRIYLSIEVAEFQPCPAVFYAFQPVKLEKIMTQKMVDELDIDKRKRDEKQHIEYVIVPENDKDHQGTVYDDKDDEGEKDE